MASSYFYLNIPLYARTVFIQEFDNYTFFSAEKVVPVQNYIYIHDVCERIGSQALNLGSGLP